MKFTRDISEVAREAASVASGIVAIDIHRQLDGPEPPHDSLAAVIESSRAHETDITPALARSNAKAQQLRSREIRQKASRRHCRKGLHLMTPENTVKGACRACDRERRRNRYRAA